MTAQKKNWSGPFKGSFGAALALHGAVLFGGGLGLVSAAEYGTSAAPLGGGGRPQPRVEEALDLSDLSDMGDEDAVIVKPRPRLTPPPVQPVAPRPAAAAAAGPASAVLAPGPEQGSSPAGGSPNGTPGGIGTGVSASYLSNPMPPYPAEARRQKQQGVVLVRVHISSYGLAEGVQLSRSSGYAALDQAAVEGVKHWKFRPSRMAGLAVASETEVPVRFNLK